MLDPKPSEKIYMSVAVFTLIFPLTLALITDSDPGPFVQCLAQMAVKAFFETSGELVVEPIYCTLPRVLSHASHRLIEQCCHYSSSESVQCRGTSIPSIGRSTWSRWRGARSLVVAMAVRLRVLQRCQRTVRASEATHVGISASRFVISESSLPNADHPLSSLCALSPPQ